MAINSIKSFPVLPLLPVRQKDATDERQGEKKEQQNNEDDSQAEQKQTSRKKGHIDEFA